MAILIKNPETERKARKLASLKGETITGAIDEALDKALAEAILKRHRPTLEEIVAATDEVHRKAGIKGPQAPVTKAEWDELNEIPGFAERGD